MDKRQKGNEDYLQKFIIHGLGVQFSFISRDWSGPMYPSIDHIIPMSKGGGHIWSNVQVAHIICNSIKSDKAVGE